MSARIFSFYINNKSGGLIYQRNFSPNAAKLKSNDQLMCASTLNGLALILKELSPVGGARPMAALEATSFTLAALDTATGLKFFVVAEPGTQGLDVVLRAAYVLYCDYVLKNPFYELDMPIHCDRFDARLGRLLADVPR